MSDKETNVRAEAQKTADSAQRVLDLKHSVLDLLTAVKSRAVLSRSMRADARRASAANLISYTRGSSRRGSKFSLTKRGNYLLVALNEA